MIVPDVNLIVYAYNTDAPHHDLARRWWEDALSADEPVGLAWVVVLGFIRVMSNRRVLLAPMAVHEAFDHARRWLARPNCQLLMPGPSHLRVLGDLFANTPISSQLVTDAHLAALAIEHQAQLHSNDSDFGRFSGLQWVNPLQ